jgi:hypothetical protein
MLGFRSVIVLLGLSLLSACISDDQNATRVQGAGAGAAIGAGIGALVGGDVEDVLIGAAAGGLVGLAAGEAVARKKADYATKEDMIVKEREIVAKQADEIGAYNIGLRGKLRKLNQDIALLEEEAARGRAALGERLDLKRRAEIDLNQARQRLAVVNREIDVSRQVYQQALSENKPVELADWDRRIRELERRRDALISLIGDFETSTQQVA